MSRAMLETARLLLRSFQPEDAPRLAELAGDFAVADGTASIPHPYDRATAEEWIAGQADAPDPGDPTVFAVVHPEEGLVGAVGFTPTPEHARAEIGYWIGRPFWGRGFATEVVRAVVGWAFREGGDGAVRRVEAFVFPGNPASARVLEKVGMRREGRLRARVLRWGEPRDVVVYGLLAEEWTGGD